MMLWQFAAILTTMEEGLSNHTLRFVEAAARLPGISEEGSP
jgi:hypothetical protein